MRKILLFSEAWRGRLFFAEVSREELYDVSSKTLAETLKAIPSILNNLDPVDEKFTDTENDNVIRHILCTSLENGSMEPIGHFEKFSRRSMAKILLTCESSTEVLPTGSFKSFMAGCDDEKQVQKLANLLFGRKGKEIIKEEESFRDVSNT